MNKQLQQAMWLQGSSRHFLGPNVTALVPLNLFAAAFTHSHSDASMRILHGYSDLGLVFGIYGAVVLFFLQASVANKFIYSFLIASNIYLFVINTWITVNGMGIPLGALFHLALAAVFTANYHLTSRAYRKFSSSD